MKLTLKRSTRFILLTLFISFFISIASVFAGAGNLISNSSLEQGNEHTPTGWYTGNWGENTAEFSYPAVGYTGNKAASVVMYEHHSGDAKWYFDDIAVNAGKEYTFSDWSNATVDTAVVTRYEKVDGEYEYHLLGYVEGTNKWENFEKTFTIPDEVVSMTVFHIIDKEGRLVVDEFSLSKNYLEEPEETTVIAVTAVTHEDPNTFPEGMVTFSFDDGFANIYHEAIPILNKAGIKSTQAILTRSFEDPRYVNQQQVINMRDQGHEIASHTRTHAHLTAISTEEAYDEISGSRLDLSELGINAKSFIYPYGEYNQETIDMVKETGYSSARSVNKGFNTPHANRYELKDQHVTSDVSFATVKNWIDSAIANQEWLILELHAQDINGGQYSNDPELLQQIVDYIEANNIKTVTLSEGAEMLHN